MPSSFDTVCEALGAIIDPYTHQKFDKKSITLQGDSAAAELVLSLGYPISDRLFESHHVLIKGTLSEHGWEAKRIDRVNRIRSHSVQEGVKALPGVKNVIAVGSGKGGVGKSTVAVNLAFALARMGARVGVLDADIYGPNVPAMLGVEPQEVSVAQEKDVFEPVLAQGCQSMSMAYLVPDGRPMVWRGPMVSGALLQLAQQTRWDQCDYLIVDLPPGTGDIQLTLSKKIPVTTSVIVTTPQVVALLDVQKGIGMFEKVGIPIAGLVENMSGFTCPHCHEQSDIFSKSGGAALAEALSIPLLGSLPLSPKLREAGDLGVPLADQDEISSIFEEMAVSVTSGISTQDIDYSRHFSNVQVTD